MTETNLPWLAMDDPGRRRKPWNQHRQSISNTAYEDSNPRTSGHPSSSSNLSSPPCPTRTPKQKPTKGDQHRRSRISNPPPEEMKFTRITRKQHTPEEGGEQRTVGFPSLRLRPRLRGFATEIEPPDGKTNDSSAFPLPLSPPGGAG